MLFASYGCPRSDLTIYKMILTQCAVCATELGLTLGKKCGRCSTRYCGAECQVQHWKEGGHDKLCKKIKKAGGAEQYNANKKYAEAVAVAAEACADDTKGQTCYICTQALHWKTKEGLVRMCVPRDVGIRARVVPGGAGEDFGRGGRGEQFGPKVKNARWKRWSRCSLCEQRYHGVVACALGWACWKTRGPAGGGLVRLSAMTQLGNGLSAADHHEDALSVREAELAMRRRLGHQKPNCLSCRAILRTRIQGWDGSKRPQSAASEMCTLDG